jgi:hypothetical protein
MDVDGVGVDVDDVDVDVCFVKLFKKHIHSKQAFNNCRNGFITYTCSVSADSFVSHVGPCFTTAEYRCRVLCSHQTGVNGKKGKGMPVTGHGGP